MPRKRLGGSTRVPAPFNIIGQILDLRPQQALGEVIAIEVLAHTYQALQEEGGFDEVTAIIKA